MLLDIFLRKYIPDPARIVCTSDIRKNGENSVPETYDVPMAFISRSIMKSEAGRPSAAITGMFANPILKNGRIDGMKSSTAEKNSDSAPRYATLAGYRICISF